MSNNRAQVIRLSVAVIISIVAIWIVFSSVKSTLPKLGSANDVSALQSYANVVSSGNYEQALIRSAGRRQGFSNGVAKIFYPIDPMTCLAIDAPSYHKVTSLKVVRVSPLACKASTPIVVPKS